MHEAAFVQQNREKWKEFEELLEDETPDADRLADLFVQVTSDLSYAQTFYPDSRTATYLNELSGQAYQLIYRTRSERRERLQLFWTRELPVAIWKSRRESAIAALVFAVAIGTGVLSTMNDPTYPRLILGDTYVNMTLQNIERGNPLAVYRQMGAIDMFLGITVNNIRVSLIAFVAGIFASIGTGLVMIQNGLMLGSFHTLFYEQDYLLTSLLGVYIHGVLEIPAIIVAGGAGIVLGNSWLFPGSYPRGYALKKGARQGMKVIVGLIPLFVIAGFLEGFVTRHAPLTPTVSLTIIGGLLAFVVWYFIIYPSRISRTRS